MSAPTSRLLSLLDSSPGPESSMPLQNTPRRPENTPTTPATGSSAKSDRVRVLREARLSQAMNSDYTQPENDATFLRSAVSSSSSKKAGGFSLNYDTVTPIKSIDIGGPDQQQRIAEFVTKSINNQSHGLTVKAAMQKLGLNGENDVLPGLEARLMPHQAIGVSWMISQEKGKEKGGILADDMGLGKTVQMIATMVKHMPGPNESHKATLIVVPAALLQQWADEIKDKTNGVMTVCIHHGKDKLKKVSQVEEYDVIITTYQTLNGDYAVPRSVEEGEEAEWLAKHGGVLAKAKFYRAIADEAQFIRNRATRASTTLAYVRAKYRWMLTGTPVTNTLADIYGLLRFGRFRPWNDWNSFNDYVARLQGVDAVEAGNRAQTILLPIILRRTKDSMLEGKPLLSLKPKTIDIVKCPFSKEEREIYDKFERESKIQLGRFMRQNSVIKNHHFILVAILRLRQLCCHPYLTLSQAEDYEDVTQLMADQGGKELSRAIKAKGRPWADQVKARYLARALAEEYLNPIDDEDEDDVQQSTCPNCKDIVSVANTFVLGCGHDICRDCVEDLRNNAIGHDGEFGNGSEKENLAVEKLYEEAEKTGHRPCPTCKKIQDISDSKIFKAIAFEPRPEDVKFAVREKREARRKAGRAKDELVLSDSDKEMDEDSNPFKSFDERVLSGDSDDDFPEVMDMFSEPPKKKVKRESMKSEDGDDDNMTDLSFDDISKPLDRKPSLSQLHFKKTKTEGSSSSSSPVPIKLVKGKGKRPAEDSEGTTNSQGIRDELVATWGRGDDDMEPSAKMLKLLEFLKQAQNRGDKSICYSQWTSMLDLIETFLSRHGVRTLRFDGKMDKKARDSTLSTFKRPDGPKVILISTKCGGVGLNLVSANWVVNMDLSWNYASESQAYDRVHRIGQNKPVYVKRVVIEDTIEERMLQLQDVKVGLAEAALGEGSGKKLHKLSVKDIKFLFGMKDNNANESQEQSQNNHQ